MATRHWQTEHPEVAIRVAESEGELMLNSLVSHLLGALSRLTGFSSLLHGASLVCTIDLGPLCPRYRGIVEVARSAREALDTLRHLRRLWRSRERLQDCLVELQMPLANAAIPEAPCAPQVIPEKDVHAVEEVSIVLRNRMELTAKGNKVSTNSDSTSFDIPVGQAAPEETRQSHALTDTSGGEADAVFAQGELRPRRAQARMAHQPRVCTLNVDAELTRSKAHFETQVNPP
mmetsp:Transcript_1377/g.3366  ORF Transcript_1377/g.3366 Transcript_1377/m.3366 type:complete len:232 (+) Transcript_1377:489-1184(+)